MKQLKWTAAQQVLMLPGQLRHSTHSVLKGRFRRLDACWLVGEVTMDLRSQQQCWQTSWVYLGIQNKASRFAHKFSVLCWFCLVKAPNRIILFSAVLLATRSRDGWQKTTKMQQERKSITWGTANYVTDVFHDQLMNRPHQHEICLFYLINKPKTVNDVSALG